MSQEFELNVFARDDQGKGASRRLRREQNLVPGIIYGANKKPVAISVPHKDLAKALENEAFYSHIINVNIEGGKSDDVIVKDIQRHPSKPVIMHIDLMRVSKSRKLRTTVPLHFINEETCVGVKQNGGSIAHAMNELEVECLPANLPEFIEVDMAAVEVGQILHISDIVMPKGVESVALSHFGADHDLPVVSVNKPKGSTDSDEETAEEGGEE